MARRSSLPVTFVVPTLAILLVLSMVPTLYAIIIALRNRELSSSSYSWVWFANFADLFSDRRFLNAVWVSVKWEIVTVVATMVVAIGLGVLMFEVASPRLRNICCLLFIIRCCCRAFRPPSSGSSPTTHSTASPPIPTGCSPAG